MDTPRLRAVLAEAIDPSGELFKNSALKSEVLPEDSREQYLNYLLSREVADLLRKEHGFDHGFFIRVPSGAFGFHADQVAAKIVERARLRSPDAAVGWLDKVLQTTKAAGKVVTALWGVPSIAAAELVQGVSLVPLSDIPSSSNLDWLTEDQNHYLPTGLSRPILLGTPKAALVRQVIIDPFITVATDDQSPRKKEPLSDYQLLDEIRNVLTAVGPCAPIQAVSWFQFDDRDLDDALLGAARMFRNHEAMPMRIETFGDFDCKQAADLVHCFYQVEYKLRKKLSIALDRLNMAIRRQSVGDRALDLCIALEAILADGRAEHSYKVSLRAALLTELGVEARGIVKATYDLRSALVHNGEAPPNITVSGKGKITSEEVTSEAIKVCGAVIVAVLRRRELPDWFEYDLNQPKAPLVDA
ncbi:HEPN domain-containing protein [Cyanobium sp. FGCU-6]|nr:HEPN domain-containing protein [Cyanobium sp. FGCU6]